MNKLIQINPKNSDRNNMYTILCPSLIFGQILPALLPLMLFASFLGSVDLFLLILPAVYWCYDPRLGIRLALILIFSQGLNEILKVAFHSPRPYWISPDVNVIGSYGNFGLPSGHAQDAVCVWGMLAFHIGRAWAYIAALMLILLVGVSRVYLNAHFPIDVVAGWVFGALILLAFLGLESPVSKKLQQLGSFGQIIASFLTSLCLLALYAVSLASIDSWQMPASWADNALAITGIAIDPFSPVEVVEAAGMVLGVGLGYALLQRRGGFKADGRLGMRFLRYLLGMFLLGLIWYGTGEIMHYQASMVFYALSYLRALLAGAFAVGVVPLIFMRLGLADAANDMI